MTYLGTVKNGVVVLEDPVKLADGTAVRVEPLTSGVGEPAVGIYVRLNELAGKAQGLPRDLARRHDHYLHGRADS